MGIFGKKEPTGVMVLEERLHCRVCYHDLFWEREAQLNTTVATFFGLDWTNATANCFVCARCGYIHWFLPGR